jgi:hypothetical protein
MTPGESDDKNEGNTMNNRPVSKENVMPDVDPVVNSHEEAHRYLSGLKLFLVMFSITLGGFLLLLDTSVVSTVSWHTSLYIWF